jgi:hypothetical protein
MTDPVITEAVIYYSDIVSFYDGNGGNGGQS